MVYEYFVLAFLTLWFLFSFLAQLNNPKVLNYDLFKILPTYRFFSPRPVSKDFCVYTRGFLNEIEGDWIPLFYKKKKWYCFIWNPELKLSKALNDFFDQLEILKKSKEYIHISIPYLILLNSANSRIFLSEKPHTHVQFMIGSYNGYEDSRITIIFISNIHDLELM